MNILDLKQNEIFLGFKVTAITRLDEIQMIACQLEHEKSGARLIHLYNDDPENLFSISFPTPPPDDSGVPHILEHVVLSGSRKYPVREPFFEMYKMSMATFINAMTGWDCTYYPVASNVRQDLFNLAEVYFDAVFNPLLTEQSFRREGHHFAPADKKSPLDNVTINGIVYNEMKGAFSNPESILYRHSSRGLFPDTIYSRESGGDPQFIPNLTYENFLDFFQTYYHPSNAFIFLYGNILTKDYLSFLKDKLDAFERKTVIPSLSRQPLWNTPRTFVDTYPIGNDEPDVDKTYISMSWLIGDATNVAEVTDMYILNHFLLGNEAAPLKKAIIQSNLGKDLIYSGFSSVGLETMFRVALKGTSADRVDDFTQLVQETLNDISKNPISPFRIESAFQQAAYHFLEILPSYPIYIMERVLDSWIYGTDPFAFLRMNSHLNACRKRYETDDKLFNKLIENRLLNNSHRLTYILNPDRTIQAKNDAVFLQKMKQIREQISDNEMKTLAEQSEILEQESGKPNPPEALAKLPQLKVHDLPPKPKHIPTFAEKLAGDVTILKNDVFSNGVNYLMFDFNLQGLPSDLWVYLPRYAESFRKLGAAGENYEQVAARLAANTGGISCLPYFTTHASDPALPVWGLRVSMKTLDDKIEPALDVLRDILFQLNPRDKERLQQVLVQSHARYQTELVHDGSETASRYASRGFNSESYLSEMVDGLPQLALTQQIRDQYETQHNDLIEKIETIRNFLLQKNRLTISFTGSDEIYHRVQKIVSGWIENMGQKSIEEQPIGFKPYEKLPREGLAGPIQVAHCALALPALHYSHPDESLLKLGTRLISLEYILNEIRFKGNAYGAWCNFNSLVQLIQFGSYNDPHIVRTLNIFSQVIDYVRQAKWTQTDINRAIIGTAKVDEKPIRPKDATELALNRHLTGLVPQLREERYARILTAKAKDVKQATLNVLDANMNRGAVCVVASREKLEQANQQMPDRLLEIKNILSTK